MSTNRPRQFWGPRQIGKKALASSTPGTPDPPNGGTSLTPPVGTIILAEEAFVIVEDGFILVENI